VRSVAAARRAAELGVEAYNILEGFEGDPDEHAQRGHKGGWWRYHKLPWRQGVAGVLSTAFVATQCASARTGEPDPCQF
jgi:hypothetical protein